MGERKEALAIQAFFRGRVSQEDGVCSGTGHRGAMPERVESGEKNVDCCLSEMLCGLLRHSRQPCLEITDQVSPPARHRAHWEGRRDAHRFRQGPKPAATRAQRREQHHVVR